MATSAIWKAMERPWLTSFAPILISFSCALSASAASATTGAEAALMALWGFTHQASVQLRPPVVAELAEVNGPGWW